MKIKIVEFANGRFAAKVSSWFGKSGYIDKDGRDYLWSSWIFIPSNCQVDTFEGASRIAERYRRISQRGRECKVKRTYKCP